MAVPSAASERAPSRKGDGAKVVLWAFIVLIGVLVACFLLVALQHR